MTGYGSFGLAVLVLFGVAWLSSQADESGSCGL
jgi:hypothetical protein